MKILVFFLLIGCVSHGVSQSAYRHGVLYTNTQDTIRGLLRYSEGTGTSSPCYYKLNSSGPVTKYLPGTISGFRYDNDNYFTSRSIGKSADVFLEILVKGNVTLYKFDDIFFIQKTDSALFELSDDMEEMIIAGRQAKVRTRNYSRMLMLLMADCVETSKKVPSTLLKEKHIIRLVSSYNTCMGYSNIYYRKKENK